jgi:hypothetical protein
MGTYGRTGLIRKSDTTTTADQHKESPSTTRIDRTILLKHVNCWSVCPAPSFDVFRHSVCRMWTLEGRGEIRCICRVERKISASSDVHRPAWELSVDLSSSFEVTLDSIKHDAAFGIVIEPRGSPHRLLYSVILMDIVRCQDHLQSSVKDWQNSPSSIDVTTDTSTLDQNNNHSFGTE